jgi:hypothetical protein
MDADTPDDVRYCWKPAASGGAKPADRTGSTSPDQYDGNARAARSVWRSARASVSDPYSRAASRSAVSSCRREIAWETRRKISAYHANGLCSVPLKPDRPSSVRARAPRVL